MFVKFHPNNWLFPVSLPKQYQVEEWCMKITNLQKVGKESYNDPSIEKSSKSLLVHY